MNSPMDSSSVKPLTPAPRVNTKCVAEEYRQ